MKKILGNILKSPIIKVVGKVADNALLGGAIGNLKEKTDTHPTGKMDWIKLVGALVPIGLLVLLGLGIITVEQVLSLAGLGE